MFGYRCALSLLVTCIHVLPHEAASLSQNNPEVQIDSFDSLVLCVSLVMSMSWLKARIPQDKFHMKRLQPECTQNREIAKQSHDFLQTSVTSTVLPVLSPFSWESLISFSHTLRVGQAETLLKALTLPHFLQFSFLSCLSTCCILHPAPWWVALFSVALQ